MVDGVLRVEGRWRIASWIGLDMSLEGFLPAVRPQLLVVGPDHKTTAQRDLPPAGFGASFPAPRSKSAGKDVEPAAMDGSVNGAGAARQVLGAEALFRAHALYVVRLLARLGAPPAEIDDLVQEVFLTAHRRGGFVPDQAKPTTWLAEIAVRVVSTARRTRRRRPTEADEAAIERATAPGTGPFEAAATAEALGRVNRALEALDLDHRAVFVLFELDGESCDAIAAGLGVPVGTVYSRLHTARRAVRRANESETVSPHLREEGGLA